jgi:hypothetical protein
MRAFALEIENKYQLTEGDSLLIKQLCAVRQSCTRGYDFATSIPVTEH